jgi:hypothetical protein
MHMLNNLTISVRLLIVALGLLGTFGCGNSENAKPQPKPDDIPLPAHHSDPNAAPPIQQRR